MKEFKAAGYLVAIVNIRIDKKLAKAHGVKMASTYVFMDKGKETYRHAGHLAQYDVLDHLKKPSEKKKKKKKRGGLI